LICHQFQQRLFKIHAFCEMIGIQPLRIAFLAGNRGFRGGERAMKKGSEAAAFSDTENGRLFPGDRQDIAGRPVSTPDNPGD
jgi:hypothetical protein